MTQTYSIKPGWKTYRFDEIAINVNDRVEPGETDLEHYVGLEHLDGDSLKIRRWGSPSDVIGQKLSFRKGDIIFGKRRAYQRKLAVAEFDGICSAHAMVLRPKTDVVLPEFLPFFMQSDLFMNRALEISVGSLSPTINWRTLTAQEFALPPLAEQRRIAEVLWAQNDVEQRYTALVSRAEISAYSYADSVFDISNVRAALEHRTPAANLKLTTLGRLCSIQVGFPFKSSEYVESGDKLLRCSNVGVKYIDWSDDITKYWPTDRRGDFEDYILHDGDVVIALDRPFVGSGFKIARVTASDLPALLLQRVGRFILGLGMHPGFLWCFLHSSSFMLQLLSQQQGTDLPHISRFDIEGAYIPDLPTDRQEDVGTSFQALEDAKNQALDRLNSVGQIRAQMLREILVA